MRVIWSLEQWAQAVAELPTSGRLPARTVLVPNLRVAHALRVALIQASRSDVLIGTRFITLLQLASNILLEAGEPHTPNDRELGPSLLDDAFVRADLKRFKLSDLQGLPGWDVSFTRTISDLDGALLSPEQCIASSDPHVSDVGRVHQALRGHSELMTIGMLMARAAQHAPSYSDKSSTLAVLTGFESPAELLLLRALSNVTLTAWAVRPQRAAYLKRFEALLSTQAPAPAANTPAGTALQHLQACLFDKGSAAAPSDASVSIALYAGVHEEVEAAASWLTREMLEHGVAAQDIAILTPNAEPYGSLLRARISSIPAEPAIAIFSERGIPLAERSDGARLLLVLRALQQDLSRERLAALLPIIRTSDETCRVRNLTHAWELLNTIAATSSTKPGSTEQTAWLDAWANAIERLGATPHTGVLDERDLQRRAELQRILMALTPAVEALTRTLRAISENEPLHLLWNRLAELLSEHVKLPPFIPPATSALDKASAQFRGREDREPTGSDALDWLDENLCSITVRSTRFGEPAVYLGTLAGVRGLRFRSVRILGLAEGAVPSAVREDPVLPDAAREQLSPFLLGSRQRAHRQLAAFDDAVRCARERLCLTAPRVSIEGSVRQPASVLLDVVRALTGSNSHLEKELDRAAASGRAQERHARDRYPISIDAQLDRVARRDLQAVNADNDPALTLETLQRIKDRTAPSEQDGLLQGLLPFARIAGLGPDRPISPSRLKTLMQCPHRFLYENILGFREAESPLPKYSLEVTNFGTWLHGIAEEFWTQHGAALASRKIDLALARRQLRELACARFETLQQTYPFANPLVAQAERETLCEQLDKLLTLDWNDGHEQTFIAVERPFGYEGECDLHTDAGPLYLRGKIDKLDAIGDTLIIRDIKTSAGKPRRRNAAPDLSIDLQLALYALVAKRLASAWGTPENVAVAYIYLRSGATDRSWWREDYAILEAATRSWLTTAREVLEQGAFARSPVAADCDYCAFKPVCAPEMHRATDVLSDVRVPASLKRLKLVEDK